MSSASITSGAFSKLDEQSNLCYDSNVTRISVNVIHSKPLFNCWLFRIIAEFSRRRPQCVCDF